MGKRKRQTKDFPAWHAKAASPWNYALALSPRNRWGCKVKVAQKPVGLEPWKTESAPIQLRVPVRKVRGWNLDQRSSATRGYVGHQHSVKGRFVFTPELPDPLRAYMKKAPGPCRRGRPDSSLWLHLQLRMTTIFPDAGSI